MDDAGTEHDAGWMLVATASSRRSARAGAGGRRAGRPRRRGRHARARQHPPPPVPDAHARAGAGGRPLHLAARALSGLGAASTPSRSTPPRAPGSPSSRSRAARPSSTTTTSSRAAGRAWSRRRCRRRASSACGSSPRAARWTSASPTAACRPTRSSRSSTTCSPTPSGSPALQDDGGARADRGRALLAVLGHEAADGGVGRARAAARAAAAHAPRRDGRGGRRTAGSSTAARRSSTSSGSAGSPATSGARTASTSRETTIGGFAATGVGVAHCPTSNLRLGAGVAPVRELLDAGVRVGLGVDGSASNERGDLLFEVKQALLVARGRGGPAAMTAREALRLGDARRRGRARPRRHRLARARASAPTSRSGGPTGSSSAAPTTRSPGSSSRRRTGSTGSSSAARRSSATGRLVRADEDEIAREHRVQARRFAAVTSSLSTHVLDTERGTPGGGRPRRALRGDELVALRRDRRRRPHPRARRRSSPGAYRLVFHPPSPFFRRVELEVELGDGHHHVPLLVSPYACAIYRGS